MKRRPSRSRAARRRPAPRSGSARSGSPPTTTSPAARASTGSSTSSSAASSQPAFLIWLRLERLGREHCKGIEGGLIVASNHRSFLDPFVLGASLPWRRPAALRRQGRALRAALAGMDPEPPRRLPRSPRRGRPRHRRDLAADPRARRSASASSPRARGSAAGRSPPRTAASAASRSRPARRSSRSRCIGSEHVRDGWKISPRKVRLRAGKAITFPRTENPSPSLAATVTGADLAEHRAPVGVARRAAADAQGGRDRRRQLGHRRRGAARARRGRGPARLPYRRAGRRDRQAARELLPAGHLALETRSRSSAPPTSRSRGLDLVCLAVPSASLPAAVGSLADRIGSPHRGAAALEGPRPAARHPALRVRGRARPRPRDRRARRPGARQGGRLRHRGPGARQPRRGPPRAARRRLRPGRADLRAHRRRRRRRDGRRRQERRLARRRGRRAPRAQRGRDRRRRGLARVRRVRDPCAAPSSRPSRASPGSAI